MFVSVSLGPKNLCKTKPRSGPHRINSKRRRVGKKQGRVGRYIYTKGEEYIQEHDYRRGSHTEEEEEAEIGFGSFAVCRSVILFKLKKGRSCLCL